MKLPIKSVIPCHDSRSFTGAWIEIADILNVTRSELVAPSRERGLKLNNLLTIDLLRRRSFTGAWIEIMGFAIKNPSTGRSFTGAWIEMLLPEAHTQNLYRRSFTGAWIEILLFASLNVSAQSLLHGSVKEKLKKHLTNINNERKVNVR